jgi:3-oxoacyl-[acyl-carrier-protein] synthase II
MNGNERTPTRVAITGLGAITPLAIGTENLWEGLMAGRSGIGPITSFDASQHDVKIAGEVHDFDPLDWLDSKLVSRTDRFCQFGLVAAEMAVTDADFAPADTSAVATVIGSGIGGATTYEEGLWTLHDRGPRQVSPLVVPSSIANIAAAHIAMRFHFGGPSTCTLSACASSADAVGWGFRMVRDGYASACVAGGTEACVKATIIAGFQNMRALSTHNDPPERACRPFDRNRDGFVLSEGAAAMVLEPLNAARARGAHVYAEVCGYGQTTDAFHETAPNPNGTAAARAIQLCLKEAGLEPGEVGYVNAHGTGTPKADLIETKALKGALASHAKRIAVSSTKSMTGHLMGAAGATEAVVSVLSLERRRVPPTLNLLDPDPECDLDYVPNESRPLDHDVALSNSMAFGGHNVCLAFRRA